MAHHTRSLLLLAVAAVMVIPLLAAPAVGAHAAGPPAQASGWTFLKTPDVGPFANTLNATAALSPTDVWAVGCFFDTNANCHTLTEHWNGSAWSVVPSPGEAGAVITELLGVSGDSPTDVWAVGDFILPDQSGGPFLLHWDGAAWRQVATPQGAQPFQAVSALAPDDVWVVGNNTAEHWDGHLWSVVATPRLGLNGGDLEGVTALSPTDVWAVGSSFDGSFRSHTLILHWNGTAWAVTPSPNMGPYTSLRSVSAVSATDVWAVGQSFPSNAATLTEHWNGTAWSVVPGPNVPVSQFYGVAAVSATDVWAVGTVLVGGGPTGNRLVGLAERWNGQAWTVAAIASAGVLASSFGAVAATPAAIFAVGNFVDAKNNQRTFAVTHAA